MTKPRNLTCNADGPEEGNYSGNHLTPTDFTGRPAAEFNDTVIFNCCFEQEAEYSPDARGDNPPDPMVDVFPADMQGVEFTRCNLRNVWIPPGSPENPNTIDGECCHERVRVQNDWDNWVLNIDSKPVRPVEWKRRERAGVSIDPRDIPDTLMTKKQRRAFEETLKPDAVAERAG